MRQALELARQGIALTSPNPCVGAVLVSPNGDVIGTGSHTYAGLKHAEVLALEAAARAGAGVHSATPPSGGWITSPAARAHVHELRHASDAIMVGVGTIIADDPLLTDRTGKPRRRPLLRVILDSRLRLPLTSRVVKTSQDD